MEDVTPDKSGFADFEPFSGQKIFAPIGSNITDVDFRLPGGGWQQACTSAFGAVFLDVDRAGQSYLEAMLSDGTSRKVVVPVSNVRNKGMSFAGLRVINGCILHVRIVAGQQAIDSKEVATPTADTVALDDFIYAEPRPLPRTNAGTQTY
jgi:hypothetical protein